MHIDQITTLLSDLEAGSITWEQALTQVTALPTAWHTTEWKRQREALIGNACAVCATTEGPFVLQHLTHCPPFKQVCQTVKEKLRQQLLPQIVAQVTPAEVEAHVGSGDERPACPTCASVAIRERKTMQPRFLCTRGEKGWHAMAGFEAPVTVHYYTKQKTTDRASALVIAREFLVSMALVTELRKHSEAIQHEATVRSLRHTLAYRSLKNTATYCKKCAFKEDLPIIKRKLYGY